MGSRYLSRALVLASLAVVARAAQGPAGSAAERASVEQHRACVVSERMLRFLRHFELSSADQRRLVIAALTAHKPASAGGGWIPPLDVLRRVESLVADSSGAGHDEAVVRELDQLAGALDLTAIPGAFECAAEGLGDPITVRVTRLYDADPSGDFVMELHWRARDGSDLRARREAVAASAISESGFEMYVRSPLSTPAPWSLYGLVGRPQSGELAGGIAEIRVDAVADLRARMATVLSKALPDQPGVGHLQACLARLMAQGRRVSAALGAGEMLGALEAWSSDGVPPGIPVPLEPAFRDAQQGEHWVWTFGPSTTPERGIAVLSASFEASDHSFGGIVGERWLECAERTRSQLFAFHLPSDVKAIPALLARIDQWLEHRPLFVVARGETLARLELGLRASEVDVVDGVVISGVFSAIRPSSVLAPRPRLVVAPGAARDVADAAYSGVDGAAFALLNDLELPLHVERWLAARAAASDGGGGK